MGQHTPTLPAVGGADSACGSSPQRLGNCDERLRVRGLSSGLGAGVGAPFDIYVDSVCAACPKQNVSSVSSMSSVSSTCSGEGELLEEHREQSGEDREKAAAAIDLVQAADAFDKTGACKKNRR